MDKIKNIFNDKIMDCNNINELEKINIANEYIHEKLLEIEKSINDKYLHINLIDIIDEHIIVMKVMDKFKSLYYHQYMQSLYKDIKDMISYHMKNSIIKLNKSDRDDIKKDIDDFIYIANEIYDFCKEFDITGYDNYISNLCYVLHGFYLKLYQKKYIKKNQKKTFYIEDKKKYMIDYVNNLSIIMDNIEKKYEVKYDYYIDKIQYYIQQIKNTPYYQKIKCL